MSASDQPKKQNVQVVVRVRPLTNNYRQGLDGGNEIVQASSIPRCIKEVSGNSKIVLETDEKFAFDFIAGEDISQKDMFDRLGKPVVDACIQGYNCTLFAYGQTGSGKTFTIQGPNTAFTKKDGSEQDRGLLPRQFEYLFSEIAKIRTKHQLLKERRRKGGCDRISVSPAGLKNGPLAQNFDQFAEDVEEIQFDIECSYTEIYNEHIHDLLESQVQKQLIIREDPKKGIFLENESSFPVRNIQEVKDLLLSGQRNRAVASTKMNRESSRSHAIFTAYIRTTTVNGEGQKTLKSSKLNIVDLAGSERTKDTQAQGERLKEACKINQSLTVLGRVIKGLSDVESKGGLKHINYRESKLTHLLKDSLGGNSKTMIICTLNPNQMALRETISTLKFAERAKKIQNKARINEDNGEGVFKKKYNLLLKEFEALKKGMVLTGGTGPSQAVVRSERSEAEQHLFGLKDEITSKVGDLLAKVDQEFGSHVDFCAATSKLAKDLDSTRKQLNFRVNLYSSKEQKAIVEFFAKLGKSGMSKEVLADLTPLQQQIQKQLEEISCLKKLVEVNPIASEKHAKVMELQEKIRLMTALFDDSGNPRSSGVLERVDGLRHAHGQMIEILNKVLEKIQKDEDDQDREMKDETLLCSSRAGFPHVSSKVLNTRLISELERKEEECAQLRSNYSELLHAKYSSQQEEVAVEEFSATLKEILGKLQNFGNNTATTSVAGDGRDSFMSNPSSSDGAADSLIPELIQLTSMMLEKTNENAELIASQNQQIRVLQMENKNLREAPATPPTLPPSPEVSLEEIAALREENEELVTKLASQEQDLLRLEELQSKLDEMQDQAESREKTLEHYEKQLSYYQKDFIPSIRKSTAEVKEKYAGLAKENESLRAENQALKGSNDEKLKHFEKAFPLLQQVHAETQEKLTATRTAHQELREQFAAQQQTLNMKTQDLITKDEALSQVMDDLAAFKLKHAEEEAAKKEAEESCADFEKIVAALEEEKALLQGQINESKLLEDALEKSLAQSRANCSGLTQQVSELNSIVEQTQNRFKELEFDHGQLEQKIQQQKSEARASRAALEQDLEKSLKKIQASGREIDELKKKCDSLSENALAYVQERLQQRVTELQSQNEELSIVKEQHLVQISELKVQNEEYKQKAEENAKQMSKLLTSNNHQAKATHFKEIKSQNSQLIAECRKLKEQISIKTKKEGSWLTMANEIYAEFSKYESKALGLAQKERVKKVKELTAKKEFASLDLALGDLKQSITESRKVLSQM